MVRAASGHVAGGINFSDKIFAIFKQEAIFYRRRGGNVSWVGHPMLDLTKKLPSKKFSRTILKLKANENILLLMPASRPQELKYILPTFLKTAKKLQLRYPSLLVYIPSCRSIFDEKFYQLRWKIDWVGNFLNGILRAINTPENEQGQTMLGGVSPSQYIKTEVDYIKHWPVGKKQVIAFHAFGGLAIPLSLIHI